MTTVVGEFEITNDVRLAPNSVVRDGLIEIDSDLAIRVGSFFYDFGSMKGKFPGALNQAVTDNATNYVSVDSAGTLVIGTAAYPVTAHIRLGRVITSGGVITHIALERAFLATSDPGTVAAASALVSALGEFTVPAGVAVLDVVYSTGGFTADQADSGSGVTIPAMGVVVAKPTATTATVAYSGVVSGFAGFTPGAEQFVGALGATVEAGSLPTVPGSVIQKIGTALDSTTLLLDPELPVVL